ncbi:cytochrome c oxidase subunit 4 isoform 1, mitochondrial [Monomorium pharaonis]|uniref:cytochrome c oxidase subunit 4 isoform 1, mitochondrial n=1 Tax=Monomorium pharaonis TaxID=307658 RepID=UPI00063F9F7A|nr:cytochrome c oxidase subunit 4 isoform 1, mitochondrial [Monomorium pharaonis]XP_012530499.1 cytochrome c oxidase subunit 4 isoform 1, mitochondrial [Monomorium pharaonis]XP_012530500.1 cytochrome c oxidase subunit 4 isoform 1, mitochondrial [Monomorium pharaonis]XP_012530501.1 cytochrome c oxidase subunit 4 isoform 1, mitochondrial [Monomorium pharaonis]
MAGRLFASRLRPVIQIQRCNLMTVDRIGNRDVVGYGYNGELSYLDRVDFPCPSIRWKENTPDIMALREKEKGDWKKLSIEEKKALYRASFRQTFSEMDAPTGEWKGIIGMTLLVISSGIWLYLYFKTFAYPPLPETFSLERRLAQLDRMKKLDMNPIDGLCARK